MIADLPPGAVAVIFHSVRHAIDDEGYAEMAARMEVLSGPLAQLYGNASGGVSQTFTREACSQHQLHDSSTWGSNGQQRHDP